MISTHEKLERIVLAVYDSTVALTTENQQSRVDDIPSLWEISLYLKRLWGQGRSGIGAEIRTEDVQVHLCENEILHGAFFAAAEE
jgi:hypothetical protein